MKRCIGVLTVMLILAGCAHMDPANAVLQRASRLVKTSPDSALHVLEHIDAEALRHRRTYVRYALLYTYALDQNGKTLGNDSLIAFAYHYYERRFASDSVLFLLNYEYGRIEQQRGNYESAISKYLDAVAHISRTTRYYDLGRVYSRIGEIYESQLNYHGMLEYHKRAYDAYAKANNQLEKGRELLYMANAYAKLGKNDLALSTYLLTDSLALRIGNNVLRASSLCNIAEEYILRERYQEALTKIRQIGNSTPDYMRIFKYKILSRIFCYQNQLDSARYYLGHARVLAEDLRDQAEMAYLSYQIERVAGNYSKALDDIDVYLPLIDSITQIVTEQSATAAEGKYYKERSDFAEFRLKAKSRLDIMLGIFVLLLIVLAVYFYKQRIRRKQEEISRYVSAMAHIRESRDHLFALLEAQQGSETQLKEHLLSRFNMLEELGRSFYERENTKAQQVAIHRQMRAYLDRLSDDPETKNELEKVVNLVYDNIMLRLRTQFPKFKAVDFDLLCYIYAGFSPQIISLLVNDTVHNVYARKSRLKLRIAASDALDKEFFVSKL